MTVVAVLAGSCASTGAAQGDPANVGNARVWYRQTAEAGSGAKPVEFVLVNRTHSDYQGEAARLGVKEWFLDNTWMLDLLEGLKDEGFFAGDGGLNIGTTPADAYIATRSPMPAKIIAVEHEGQTTILWRPARPTQADRDRLALFERCEVHALQAKYRSEGKGGVAGPGIPDEWKRHMQPEGR